MYSTPDITKAQIVAVVQAVLAVIVAFGGHVSPAQAQALISLSTALAVALPIADAVIRHGRSRHGRE